MSSDIQKANGTKKMLKAIEPYVEDALPDKIGRDRFLNVALTTLRKNPDLVNKCNQRSLLGALVQSAQLGLMPNTLGQAYIIPYGGEATFVLGYRGMIDLARRSGDLESINARCVYENDHFELEFGTEENIEHRPYYLEGESSPGEMIGAYCIARLKDGGQHIEFMSKGEIDGIKDRAPGSGRSDSPWRSDYDQMAKKTVVRRAFKYLPVSTEDQQAVAMDGQSIRLRESAQPAREEKTVDPRPEDVEITSPDSGSSGASQENDGPELEAVDPNDWQENFQAAKDMCQQLGIADEADLRSHADMKEKIAAELKSREETQKRQVQQLQERDEDEQFKKELKMQEQLVSINQRLQDVPGLEQNDLARTCAAYWGISNPSPQTLDQKQVTACKLYIDGVESGQIEVERGEQGELLPAGYFQID